MKQQGVILYGKSSACNIEEAYNIAINNVAIGAENSVENIKKHIMSSTYPNFLLIKKSSESNEIAIDEVRFMIEFLAQKPTLLGKRVVIIEEFDTLSKNAANSILKTLEEPSENDLLILTTTKLFATLPTIRSRCIKVNVKSENVVFSDYNNKIDYINAVLKSSNTIAVQNIVNFIDSGSRNINNFIKQLTQDQIDIFQDVILLYFGYKFSDSKSEKDASTFLKLQTLINLSKNTYPDSKSIIAACLAIL